MGVVKLDAYVLILRGKDSLSLVNGLSTNKVETTCTTVFTTTKAKIIDMVDVIDKGDFIALVANTGCAVMLPGLASNMGKHAPTKVLPVPLGGDVLPDVRLSDHSPFWDQGYNAIMITDTSFLRNPNYHEPTDTVKTLDLTFFSKVVEGLSVSVSKI